MLVGVPLQPTAAATSAAGFLLENRGNALGRASKARAPDIMGAVVAAVIERFLPTGSWLACRLRASLHRAATLSRGRSIGATFGRKPKITRASTCETVRTDRKQQGHAVVPLTSAGPRACGSPCRKGKRMD